MLSCFCEDHIWFCNQIFVCDRYPKIVESLYTGLFFLELINVLVSLFKSNLFIFSNLTQLPIIPIIIPKPMRAEPVEVVTKLEAKQVNATKKQSKGGLGSMPERKTQVEIQSKNMRNCNCSSTKGS
jgi:hypothetical protein